VDSTVNHASPLHSRDHLLFPEKNARPIKKQKLDLTTSTIERSDRLFATIPDPKNSTEKPDTFLRSLVLAVVGETLEVKPASSLDGYFPVASEEQKAGYTMDIVSAARNNDVDKLRQLRDSGSSMNCFNRFGESLLHMACRRGFEEMTEFLLNEPDIQVKVADDCGRTPMHDTCWAPAPNLIIAKRIIERDPSLLFVADKRGFTAFDYARPEHWNTWKQFLVDNKSCLEKLGSKQIYSRFCC